MGAQLWAPEGEALLHPSSPKESRKKLTHVIVHASVC